jgi:predicted nucleotidyltransferase component of viral defense system
MKVSLEYLERCAGETGYQVGTLEKVTRLGEIAAEIARHPLLGRALALKGGTALNLCVGDAPTRMSVDLDYNYIAHVERDKMLTDRPGVEAAVEEIVRRLDNRVQRSADAFANRKLHATYRSVLGGEARVEVDLNFLFRQPLDGVAGAELWQPGELDRPRIRVVSVLELCVGKLLALLDRAAPRDAWDVARLPVIAAEVLASARFRRVFVAMSVILDHPLWTYSCERMNQLLTPRVIASQLIPMLATAEPPAAAKLVDRAWDVVAPFVELNAAESEYVALVGQGELRPKILFSNDADSAKIIETHPAICWKIENVRKHRRGGNVE